MKLWPTTSRSAREVERVLRHATGPRERIERVYSDNAPEFIAACNSLGIVHSSPLPDDPQANGIIERRVQFAKRGGRALLLQAGLPDCFAFYAIRAFLFARNLKVKEGPDGRTAFSRRHAVRFTGKLVEFGSLVYYRPPKTSKVGKTRSSYGPQGGPGNLSRLPR